MNEGSEHIDLAASTKAKAEGMWAAFNKNQQTLVRFGIFPDEEMRKAQQDGFGGRELAIALMECAGRDGGIRA